MPRRKVNHRPLQKYSIGDLREIITIHVRSVTAPTFNTSSFTEVYDTGEEDWANVITLSLKSNRLAVFNGVNIPEGSTHIFTVRFDENWTSENVINYAGNYYKVLSVDNPEMRDEYSVFSCRLLGDKDLDANQ